MLLKELINNLPIRKRNIEIKGLETNSKKIKKGFIFFAIKGHNSNGEKYIQEAVSNGASVIICSPKCRYTNRKVIIKRATNVRYLLSEISSKFYKIKPKNIIAVTGTNGKTSVADLFYQILNLNNVPVASIGTLGIKFKDSILNSELTSPDTVTLHKTLEKIKKKNIDNVIIEASSHGLHQHRIDHLNITAGIFTNFSQDHLDYHKTMKLYLDAKLRLFKKIIPKRKTLISDSSIKEYSKLKKISKKKRFKLIDINPVKKKLYKFTNLKLNEFQIKNLAMAIIASKLIDLKEKQIFNSIKKIKSINGRLELIKTFPNKIKVYVDFAHTPDALFNSLSALKKMHNRNITIVFGCGGDRDKKKRPLMGKIASNFCQKIFVTDDNPRSENPKKIRNEIIRNIKKKDCYSVGDRAKAIKFAILKSGYNEVVLVAGKGHETKQVFKNKTISISDKEIIKKIKLAKSKKNNRQENFAQNKKILSEIIRSEKFNNFHGLSIDSRTVKKDNLFLTIKGKKYDGSKFVSKALKKGAKYVVSSKTNKKYKDKIIRVNSVIKFLNEFASKKRNKSAAKILAVTGSAGKTSLKNLLKSLLENFGKTLSSPKSYNNHYGVPLSLSQINTNHEYGIFEVGMSKAGEINKLSKIIRPHIGIITNIGEAHIENFKNLRGIADAKGELIKNIEKTGTLILNRDDKYFRYLEKKAKLRNLNTVSFGINRKADVHPISVFKNNKINILNVRVKNQSFKIKYNNLNIHNILSSLALLKELKLDLSKIIHCFKDIEPSEGRGKIYNIKRYSKSFKLIDESYNANPLSVKNAIKKFSSLKKQNFKKYLLLGDMLELGKRSEIFHKNLSTVINNTDIDKVFVKGIKTLVTYKNISKDKRGNIFQKDEDVDFTLKNIIANNDYLMIKGSNATGLKDITKKMIRGY